MIEQIFLRVEVILFEEETQLVMRLFAYLHIDPSPITNEITIFCHNNKPILIIGIHSNLLNFSSNTFGSRLKPLRLIEKYSIGVFNAIIDMLLIEESANPI